MNLYERWMLPPILDLIMRQKHLVCFSYFAREAAGAAGTRHSLRPLLLRDIVLQSSGASRRESADL